MEWAALAGVVGTDLVFIVMKMEKVFANARAWKEHGCSPTNAHLLGIQKVIQPLPKLLPEPF